jgi:Domain of unknown function (DUF4349)
MDMSSSFRAIGARARRGAVRTILLAGAASIGTSLLLTACSATAGSGGGAAGTSSRRLAAAVPAPGAPAGHNGAAASSDQAAGNFSGAKVAKLALSTQSIIYTADMTVRVVKNVTGTASQVTEIATDAGGYVAGEREYFPRGKHGIPQINLVLKIPAAQFSQTLAKLSDPAIGKRLSFSQRAQNVTQQVADVASRVSSAQAAIKQLRALLKKAGSVGQLLSVQNEINRQESNLEALVAQQRALAHQTSYGTVSVLLVGHHAAIVKKHKKNVAHGFVAGLRGGWHALVVVVGWVLTALGSALPFLIPAGLIGAIAFESRRRLARRKNPPAPEPPPAASA